MVTTNRMPQKWRNLLTPFLLASTKTVSIEITLDVSRKQSGSRSAQQSHRTRSGSKLFDTEGIPDFFGYFSKNVILKKIRWWHF